MKKMPKENYVGDSTDKYEKSNKITRKILNALRKKIKILIVLNILLFALILCVSSFNVGFPKVDLNGDEKENEMIVLPNPIHELVKNRTNCSNVDQKLEVIQDSKYFILKNFIRAAKYFECHESVTYTTNGEFIYLDNVIPIVERWRAPVSVAVYAPGNDFLTAMNAIFYLRNCSSSKDLVTDYVTFHIFFDKTDDRLTNVVKLYDTLEPNFKCDYGEKLLKMKKHSTFRFTSNLKYPINVARNLARNAATTHFVLASDIELYPNPNFPQKFLEMIANDTDGKLVNEKNVFVLPVFEIENGVEIPTTKMAVKKLFDDHKIFWFHQKLCAMCHSIPDPDLWLNDTDYETMKIFKTVKRQGRFGQWEPFYVGTNKDPLFDERLSYEGAGDKMTQAYALCLLNYNLNVLSNGFLIHKNGIKAVQQALVGFKERRKFLTDQIAPEMQKKYGNITNCQMI